MNRAIIYLQCSGSFQTDSPSFQNPWKGRRKRRRLLRLVGTAWAGLPALLPICHKVI